MWTLTDFKNTEFEWAVKKKYKKSTLCRQEKGRWCYFRCKLNTADDSAALLGLPKAAVSYLLTRSLPFFHPPHLAQQNAILSPQSGASGLD